MRSLWLIGHANMAGWPTIDRYIGAAAEELNALAKRRCVKVESWDYSVVLITALSRLEGTLLKEWVASSLDVEIAIFAHRAREAGADEKGCTERTRNELLELPRIHGFRLFGGGAGSGGNPDWPYRAVVGIHDHLTKETDLASWSPPDWEAVLGESRKRSLIPLIGFHRHKMNQLLVPIDLDIQTLLDCGFAESVWRRMVDDWKRFGAGPAQLDKLVSLVHTNETGRPSLDAMLMKGATQLSDADGRRLEEIRRRIEELVPARGLTSDRYSAVSSLAAQLKPGGLDTVKRLLEQGNSFATWLRDLNEALDEASALVADLWVVLDGDLALTDGPTRKE